jgi:hypothetical protein
VLDALADDIELPLETHVVAVSGGGGKRRPTSDEQLPEHRLDGDRAGANGRVVGRDIAPAENDLPFLGDDCLELRFDLRPQRRIAWEKHKARAVLPLWRQCESQPRGLPTKEAIRHLDKDAGAVAGVRFTAACAAMQQVDEHLEGLLNNPV